MSSTMTAGEILDREFLEVRAKILELAASMDRLQRAGGAAPGDERVEKIRQALAVVGGMEGDRAERIQCLFSLPYLPDWRTQFDVSTRN